MGVIQGDTRSLDYGFYSFCFTGQSVVFRGPLWFSMLFFCGVHPEL